MHIILFLLFFLVSSTILEEEKLQQKERNRMEMRRQVTVSWDSGGPDEAPPKVRRDYTTCVCVSGCLLVYVCKSANRRNEEESLLCLCRLQGDTLIIASPVRYLVRDYSLSDKLSCGVSDIFSAFKNKCE